MSLLLTSCQSESPSINAETEALQPSPIIEAEPSQVWNNQISQIKWVAYTPPSSIPEQGIEATIIDIEKDISLLHSTGFTGLVTYQSQGVMGADFVDIAQKIGFEGVLLGIWDPLSQDEIHNAVIAAQLDIVKGVCVGNEGLGTRYTFAELSQAIRSIKRATNKAVTTSEEIDDYLDENLLKLGDWIFPNAHPYLHNQSDPEMAVRWTKAAFEDISRRSDRFVLFKEVGLPTAGDPTEDLSEANQDQYYQQLTQTNVKFVYFEAFDQPWKTTLPVEPYWGIFHSDRRPKLFSARLLGLPLTVAPMMDPVFYVYKDNDYPGNHFNPSGLMGDLGDITLEPDEDEEVYSGKTAIRIDYAANGQGPHNCKGLMPCRWAGIYWLEPPNNWGDDEFWKDRGYNLSEYSRLILWAKANQEVMVEFKIGGILASYGDSQKYPVTIAAELTPAWKEFTIDLTAADLTHIIGGFVWVSDWYMSPQPVSIFLDEIRYEK